jgi:phosphatidylglycerophosphatase A
MLEIFGILLTVAFIIFALYDMVKPETNDKEI